MDMSAPTASPAIGSAAATCLGRFLIDLPPNARLAGAGYKYDFVQIEKPVAMSRSAFESELQSRQTSLTSVKHEIEPSLLRQMTSPEGSSRIFAFWEMAVDKHQVKIEGYRWIAGNRFLLKDQVDTKKQPVGVDVMRDYLGRLRDRADGDIPTDAGYCFSGGFIAGKDWVNERIDASFNFPNYPDVTLQIFVMPKGSPGPDLLDRMGGVLGSLGAIASRVRVLRSGNRNSGAYKGQEYLVSAPNSGGMQAHSLIWETQGEGTMETPFVNIELVTGNSDAAGNPQRTALSDEQVLALWDRIIASFRIRPVAAPTAKTSDAASAHKRPLGERAMTGRTCPQSGWWRCEDFANVAGGRDRYFAEGEVMSGVEVPAKPDLWERLRGEQPIGRRATRWELVSHAAKDEPPAAD